MTLKKSIFLIWTLFFFFPHIVSAQLSVSRVDASFNSVSEEGIIYALPRTVIQVEVMVEQKELLAGPLRNYAEEYLGITNYISQNSFEYSIKDIRLSTYPEPDPEQYYFVSMGEKTSRGPWETMLNLNGKGVITSVNTLSEKPNVSGSAIPASISADEVMEIFRNYAELNRYARVDTIVRTINIDTLTIEDYSFRTTLVDKPLEVKAQEVAEMIDKLREGRYNLLTGYQEVNYSEGALKFMYEELLNMEDEYLRLFTGATVKKDLSYIFSFIPSPENVESMSTLFRISGSSGIGSGEEVSIMIIPSGNTAAITSSDNGTMQGIYYRLPEEADIKVLFQGNTICQLYTAIAQMGKLGVLPADAMDVEFDEQTGGIKSVKVISE